MAFLTSPLSGADLATTYAPISATTPDVPGLPFVPGTRGFGNGGAEYVFVKATAAITQYNILGVSQSGSTTSSTATFTAAPLTKALADAGAALAVAQIAIADTYSAWVQVKGPTSLTVKNACLPSVPLYTSASAGMLDDTSASQTRIYGIRIEKTATASGAAKVAWIGNMTV